MRAGLADARRMQPGQGSLTLTGTATPDRLAAELEYKHRVTPSMAAFAQGWAGAIRGAGNGWQPDYGVGAGVSFDW